MTDNKKRKKKSLFFKVMILYSVIIMIFIVGACAFLWNALVDYQKEYDDAKADAANGHVRCIEEFVAGYTKDYHKNIMLESWQEENPYYAKEAIVDYVISSIDFSSLTYEQNAKNYKENRPVYDIKSGDKVIATVTLGVKEMDEYGFNVWKVAGTSVDDSFTYANPIAMVVDNSMEVFVNGVKVTDESVMEVKDADQSISERIKELSGVEFKMVTYRLTNVLNYDDVIVKLADGTEVPYTEKNNERVYNLTEDESKQSKFLGYADPAIKAYIKYNNKHLDLASMLSYTVEGSQVNSAIKRADESVVFARKPSTIDYVITDITNIHEISADMFCCDAKYVIEKVVNSNKMEETLHFALLLRKQNGKWLLDTMNMKE